MIATTQHVPRQVIENKLLTALDDKSKVAALLNDEDCLTLLHALKIAIGRAENTPEGSRTFLARSRSLHEDLEKLHRAAFG